jgi:hypothetical protein
MPKLTNVQKVLFEGCIATINQQIEILRNAGVEIKDSDDFEWCVDSVNYSPAMDTVCFKLRASEDEEQEYRRAV